MREEDFELTAEHNRSIDGALGMNGPSAEANEVSRRVIGAAIEVHRALGPGFLESVYENALCIEMGIQGIGYERQRPIDLYYKGHPVGNERPDLIVEQVLVVDLKAVDELAPIFTAQMISYLRATSLRLGLIINFNNRRLKDGVKRVVL